MRRIAPMALMLGVAMGAGSGTARAQQTTTTPRRSVMVRVDTSDNAKVTVVLEGLDSLLKSLAKSRQLEERIGMALREYGTAQMDLARRRALEDQLQKITEGNLALLSKIQVACTSRRPSEHSPDGYLGVTFSISGSIKREGNGPEVYRFDEPPEIILVESGSPAERAGVRRGDRLMSLDGKDVVGREVILAYLLVPGRRLPVRVVRDGREQTITVVVQKRPEGFSDQCTDLDLTWAPVRSSGGVVYASPGGRFSVVRPAPVAKVTAPSPPSPVSAPDAPAAPAVWTFEAPPPVAISGFSSIVAGAQLTSLTDDFKELTGADAGILVQRVLPKTPAAIAGLRGGDVIVEGDDRPVLSARVLQRMIGEADNGTLKLKVVRKGKARTVWLKW